MSAMTYIAATAEVSGCGRWRWSLHRRWGPLGPSVVWVMLNPSTTDATPDDPTVRRVVGFSARAAYRACTVVNLWAWRATDPRSLLAAAKAGEDVVGNPATDRYIARHALACPLVVVAWGANARPDDQRARRVLSTIRAHGREPMCLGVTQSGAPRHPLMVSGDTSLIPYCPKENR